MTDADIMLREIRDQANMLGRLQQEVPLQVSTLTAVPPPRIWLVGCGDMHFAAQIAAATAELCFASPVRALASMEMRWWRRVLKRDDWVIGASVSGRTPRTIEALQLAAAAGATTLLLTDDVSAPLASRVSQSLPLQSATTANSKLRDPANSPNDSGHPREALELPSDSGDSRSDSGYPGYAAEVPQTRSFLAALFWMLALTEGLFGRRREDWGARIVAQLPDQIEAAMAAMDAVLNAHDFTDLQEVIVLASGPFSGVAEYGAAKHLEFAIPARARCLEEFQHLDAFIVDRGHLLCFLALDRMQRQRFLELAGVYGPFTKKLLAWTLEVFSIPGELPLVDAVFTATVAMQCQAYKIAKAMGRDVNRWVGGVRRDEVYAFSNQAIRASRILTAEELDQGNS